MEKTHHYTLDALLGCPFIDFQFHRNKNMRKNSKKMIYFILNKLLKILPTYYLCLSHTVNEVVFFSPIFAFSIAIFLAKNHQFSLFPSIFHIAKISQPLYKSQFLYFLSFSTWYLIVSKKCEKGPYLNRNTKSK